MHELTKVALYKMASSFGHEANSLPDFDNIVMSLGSIDSVINAYINWAATTSSYARAKCYLGYEKEYQWLTEEYHKAINALL